MYSFPNLEPVYFSMSGSSCCFLTCIQISQEASQVVWYSQLLKNFPQSVVIHIVQSFVIVNKAEVDVFLEMYGFLGGTSGKEPTCLCRRCKKSRFSPGSGRSHGGGHGSSLQYSCLGNTLDRGAWKATVHRVTKSWTRLKQLNIYANMGVCLSVCVSVDRERERLVTV